MSGKRTNLWWVRRDLRLHDNPALRAAMEGSSRVLPVFILDPKLLESPYSGPKRLSFLLEGLQQLDRDLEERGSALLIQRGEPPQILKRLCAAQKAGSVYAQEDFSPYSRQRDQSVARQVDLVLTPGLVTHHPTEVLKEDGSPYTVFTPFSRRWKALDSSENPLEAPGEIPSPAAFEGDPLPPPPDLDEPLPFSAGETKARQRLEYFLKGRNAPIYSYGELRNRVDLEATSGLSPYLRFGMLSPRLAIARTYQALHDAPNEKGRKGAETFLNELIWREFFQAILYHYPFVRRHSFRPAYRNMAWENDPDLFSAWCQGQTGYPLVDAAMRQLLSTGWMHNRARMVVASFLTKDLLIDWRWGERWFMQHLVDGDPAANNGGWQWSAGTGTDAAPYFRIFNPISQSKKFDPESDYIHRWVPELASVPPKYIHEPWTMPPEVQRESGCKIGKDYPEPVIDHGFARERALAVYKGASG